MNGWRDLFNEHILDRGEDYYYEGAVRELHKTEFGYQAVVEGTVDYEVEIEIEGRQVCGMDCTCPYAEDGNYCKHMAAVLFEIERLNEKDIFTTTEETDPENLKKELEEIVERIPEAELRAFVKGIAAQDSEIRNLLVTKYAVKIDEKQMNQLKQGVDQIVWQYGDRSGYIDYQSAWDFSWEIKNYLEEKADILIERNCYRQAFELTNYVFKIIGNIEMDDSDGGISLVADACYDKWKEILEHCSEEEKNEMFSWFVSHLSCDYVIDYIEDYMEDFLTHEFQNREILEKKLKHLDEVIEARTSSTDCGSTWSTHYGQENNIKMRLAIMEKLNYSEEEIRKYRKEHRRFSAVRELEIQENLENGNLDEAIGILQESKILDQEYPELVGRYSTQLISLYEAQQDKEAYKKELLFYVFTCPQRDLVHIYKLKEICDDKEWDAYRERILKNSKNYSIRYPFMEAEGMYEQMLEGLKKEGSIYGIDKYEEVLKENFPEQVRDIYISYLYREAECAGNRGQYRVLMKYLKKILGYPDGREKAAEIAEDWRSAYSRRTAMMDELRKAGF